LRRCLDFVVSPLGCDRDDQLGSLWRNSVETEKTVRGHRQRRHRRGVARGGVVMVMRVIVVADEGIAWSVDQRAECKRGQRNDIGFR
jgi:hypothetical protein